MVRTLRRAVFIACVVALTLGSSQGPDRQKDEKLVGSQGARGRMPALTGLSAQSMRPNSSGYEDDTFLKPAGAVERTFEGLQARKPLYFQPRNVSRGNYIDARRAIFLLSNSRNANPTTARPCAMGPLPINKYPLYIWSASKTTVAGGVFKGSVPQRSDWRPTYCDSAAIVLRESPNATVDGVRIAGAWDGVRAWIDSDFFVIKNSWLSDLRDDAIENDTLVSGKISDTLVDGTFVGLSLRPVRNTPTRNGARVEISGSLLRMSEYPYEGQWRLGALLKVDEHSPRVAIRNSVVAVDGPRSSTPVGRYWTLGWEKLEVSSNNLFLWLSDGPLPAKLALPPSGFRVLRGAQARAAWAAAKKNWIDCHPKLGRISGDPLSISTHCRSGHWGGYTN